MIYFDNAATSLHKPPMVYDAVLNAMKSFGNSGRSSNDSALSASRVIYSTREKLCSLVNNSSPNHVIFTSNSTEALNISIFGLLTPDDHVIITEQEHNSVLRPVYARCSYSFLKVDYKGILLYDDLNKLIRPNTKAIICNHASNVTGNIANLDLLGEFAQKHDLIFIVDASQSLGEIPVDMEKYHIDVLCFTGHKGLMGPQGTGGLCIRDGIEIRPLKFGGTGVQTFLHDQPHQYPTRLEAGTLNGHGIAGLLASLNFIQDIGIENIYKHLSVLTKAFYDQVSILPHVHIIGDFESHLHAPIVSLTVDSLDSGKISSVLMDRYHIATRSGALCAPVLMSALGLEEFGVIRFSFGFYNTMDEIDIAVDALREIIS